MYRFRATYKQFNKQTRRLFQTATFRQLPLVKKTIVSSDTYILSFQLPDPNEQLTSGQHVKLRYISYYFFY
mgnify:CR=1 FL=1